MKIASLGVLALAAASWPLAALAGPRSSASYAVPTESVDAGGAKAVSVNYSNDGSLGGIGGVSTAAAPTLAAKHSYIGQLYEVTNLLLFALPASVNEGTTSQLTAQAVLDDASLLTLANTQVAWSIVNGPINSINASGLATAAIVYQNTPATVRGDFSGKFGTLGLTVVNVGIDNFGSYAGDGIDDAWQVLNFGLNNPNAGPTNDPDGDGQNNFFEYTAGTIPRTLSPNSTSPSRKSLGNRTRRMWFSARGFRAAPTPCSSGPTLPRAASRPSAAPRLPTLEPSAL